MARYLYVGLTDNVERRVGQHNSGKERTTRSYRPFEILLTESFETRSEARTREKYLKSGVGKEWLKQQFPYSVHSGELVDLPAGRQARTLQERVSARM